MTQEQIDEAKKVSLTQTPCLIHFSDKSVCVCSRETIAKYEVLYRKKYSFKYSFKVTDIPDGILEK